MKKKITLPTIIGVFVLFIGMIAGIYLINSTQSFKLSANIEAVPKNIKFSNISDTGVTVSWTTDIESVGFIKWGNSEKNIVNIAEDSSTEKQYVHSIDIVGTQANSNIFVKINSNSKDYDNNGISWQTKTIAKKSGPINPSIAAGSILLQDGKSPKRSIVYLLINGTTLSAATSSEGTYIIPVSSFVENISANTVIEINVNAGISGTAQAVMYPGVMKAIPAIVLGKTYDFRTLEIKESESLPKSSLSAPESINISSRFEIQKNEDTTIQNNFTIESIDEGEIINTTDPEFFGGGPKNTTIEIMVQSELQEVALVTDAKGKWNWNPPKDLEPGEHKVTLKWRDATGVLRTLTRTFVVQASEGPAFESTPSASPKNIPTESPISTSSAMPIITKTPIATAQPTPETGDIAPTLGLFMMGIGILFSSIYIWNKSNVY